MAAVFEALASPRRREILRLVWDGERMAGDIHEALPEITFGAVSQHLKVLEAAGLVRRRDEGRFHFYAARRKELGPLGRWLEAMWDDALETLKARAEAEGRGRLRPSRGSRRPHRQRRVNERSSS